MPYSRATTAPCEFDPPILVKNLNKTAVFVTHDLHEAFVLGTRICLMDKGRIVLNDTPENFVESDLPLARAYLETIKTER